MAKEKKKKSKVNHKLLDKEKSDTLGIEIANKAAEKRRKVQGKITTKKVKHIKEKLKKAKKIKIPKIRSEKSYFNFKLKEKISSFSKVLTLAIVLILIVVGFQYRHIFGITLKKDVTKKDNVLIELATPNNDVYSYKNEVLTYSNGILKTYSKYGKKTWEYKFEEIFTPDININEGYLQVTNKDTGYIYVFENGYEIARIKIEGEIRESSISSKGETAVLYSYPGIKSAIGVYGKNGKESSKIKLENNNVINFKLTDDKKYIVYTEVVMQGVSISEKINVVKRSNINDIKEIKNINAEIINSLKLEGDNIDVVTDSRISRYEINGNVELEERLDNKNITYVDYDNKDLVFLSKKRDADSTSQLVIKKIGSVKEKTVSISDVPRNLHYEKGLIYVTFQKSLEVYNIFGSKIKGYESENIISSIRIFNSGKSIAVIYSNKIEIVNI